MSTPEEVRRVLREGVARGEVEIVEEREGEAVYRLTDAGRRRVESWLDEAMDGHGERAAEVFAVRMQIPLEMADAMIAHRRAERGGG